MGGKILKAEELNNVIIPHRFIPFDLGTNISAKYLNKIKEWFISQEYSVLEMPGLLNSLSRDVLVKVKISDSIRLYIYSYGIGVFVLEDTPKTMNEKYAIDYCEYRKIAHKCILDFSYGNVSIVIRNVINNLRKIVKNEKNIRLSANDTWEYNGLSYVMTVSYIITRDKEKKYSAFTEIDKKNLQIMLQPSLAHKEDTMAMLDTEGNMNFNPYNFEVTELDEPRNWVHIEGCSVYISWAAVVVYLQDSLDKYMEIVECLEVDLQAMWLYTYCQYINLKNWRDKKKISSGKLKEIKYNFQKKFNEFISDDDSSIPVYIGEIRGELINTSGINTEKNNYMEYIEFCIDETESYETEQQRKYSVINEILLFIIAFVQIAPMLYSALLGDYNDLALWPVIFMIALVVISIFFIVRKS